MELTGRGVLSHVGTRTQTDAVEAELSALAPVPAMAHGSSKPQLGHLPQWEALALLHYCVFSTRTSMRLGSTCLQMNEKLFASLSCCMEPLLPPATKKSQTNCHPRHYAKTLHALSQILTNTLQSKPLCLVHFFYAP